MHVRRDRGRSGRRCASGYQRQRNSGLLSLSRYDSGGGRSRKRSRRRSRGAAHGSRRDEGARRYRALCRNWRGVRLRWSRSRRGRRRGRATVEAPQHDADAEQHQARNDHADRHDFGSKIPLFHRLDGLQVVRIVRRRVRRGWVSVRRLGHNRIVAKRVRSKQFGAVLFAVRPGFGGCPRPGGALLSAAPSL